MILAVVGYVIASESGKSRKAHSHGPGAQVIVIAGKGYFLMWPAGLQIRLRRLEAGKLIRAAGTLVPSSFHHRQGAGPLSCSKPRAGHFGHPWRPNLSKHEGGHLPEHEDEPPEIRAMYEAELEKEGMPLRMGPIDRKNRLSFIRSLSGFDRWPIAGCLPLLPQGAILAIVAIVAGNIAEPAKHQAGLCNPVIRAI